MDSKRIEYIDALRGFIMLLVVFGHIEIHSFHEHSFLYADVCKYFNMPLFFFISGYVAYKNFVWDIPYFLKESIKKIRTLFIPALIFGLSFTYLIANNTFLLFINDIAKQGYWFTIALLEMFLVYYTTNLIAHQIDKTNNNKVWRLCALCTIILIYLVKIASAYYPSVNNLMNITSFYYLPFYYPHFIFGILASKYKPTFKRIIDNPFVMAGAILLFLSIFINKNFIINTCPYGKELAAMLMSFSGIQIVYGFFRKYQASFSQSTRLGRTLQYIGKRTLDIYMIHYFFLPYLPNIHQYLDITPNLVMELFGFFLAFIIIGCCLIVSNIIRLSDFLAYWLLGGKKR